MKRTLEIGQQGYQGDVSIFRVANKPTNRTYIRVASEHGRLIVAKGEATGHHHSVAERTGVLLERDHKGLMWLTVDELVGPAGVMFEHQEHGPTTMVPGVYVLGGQRVYDLASGEARPVLD